MREAFLKHADRLLARALTLRETGEVGVADELAQRALQFLDQAENLEKQQAGNSESVHCPLASGSAE